VQGVSVQVLRILQRPLGCRRADPSSGQSAWDAFMVGGPALTKGSWAGPAALQLRDPALGHLETDPLLDPLRKEPRFQAIERELTFPTDMDGWISGR
jgi:hypothetical protein